MNTNIRKYLGLSVLSAALLLTSGIPALAKNSETVTISHDVTVNGTTLPAGHYTVEWETHSPEGTIVFVQHHRVVLSTAGTIWSRKANYRNNTVMTEDNNAQAANLRNLVAVVYSTAPDGTKSLVEIHLATSNKILVFNQ